MVDCLDPAVTQFPRMTLEELNEFCAGPYLSNLAPSYVTTYRVNELKANPTPYEGIIAYHAERRILPAISGWMFDQMQPPNNWNGVWSGMRVANNVPWTPVRILTVPKIPARYGSRETHTVVIAYVPANWPLLQAAPGYLSASNQRIQMFCCGPRLQSKCKSGARTVSCCAHVATAAYILGVLAHDPQQYKSTWRDINYIDAGPIQTEAHSADLLFGLVS